MKFSITMYDWNGNFDVLCGWKRRVRTYHFLGMEIRKLLFCWIGNSDAIARLEWKLQLYCLVLGNLGVIV